MLRVLFFFIPINILFSENVHRGDDLVKKGVYAFYNYEYDRSLEILNRARIDYPNHPGVHFIWAAASWSRGLANHSADSAHVILEKSLSEVTPIYEKLVNENPIDPYYRLYQGSAIGLNARVTLAKKKWLSTLFRAYRGFIIINKVHENNPEITDAHLPLGIVEYYSGRSNRLLKFAIEIFGLNPSTISGLNQISKAAEHGDWSWIEANGILSFLYLWVEDDPVLAAKYSRRIADNFPNNFYYRLMLLEATTKNGNYEESEKLVANLNSISEKLTARQKAWYFPYLKYEIAFLMFEKKNYEGALALAQEAIKTYDGELDIILGFAYLLLGKIYDLNGNRNMAKSNYESCLNLNNLSSAMIEAYDYMKRPYTAPK